MSLRDYAPTNKNVKVPSVHQRASTRQVRNNDGAFVFALDDKSRLERFLILGTDGGTYNVSEKDLTKQNVDWLKGLISRDSGMVLSTVLDVSVSGRAYRNDAAIFVLALVLNFGSESAKQDVVNIVPQVARTATMVYDLAQFLENLGGWGRSKRRAVANWFASKTPDELAYQAVKYRQRNGWTLRDLMRLSHPVGVDKSVGNFILGNYQGKFSDYDPRMPQIIHGFTEMQKNVALSSVLSTLDRFPSLPWEAIPTQYLKSPEVWKKLFYNGQLNGQALVRNVTRMAKIGAFSDRSFTLDYAAKLEDEFMIDRTRLHPMQYLLASVVYEEGQINRNESYGYGVSRNKTWNTDPTIIKALEAGFYISFKNVTPANKKFLLGVDVSGSMSWNAAVGSDLSAAQGAAAMAMMIAKVEEGALTYGFANSFRNLNITPSMSFREIMTRTKNQNFGSTNMSLPMQFALEHKLGTEVFVIITDNEINTGRQPSAYLNKYRQATGIDAKLIVMGMTSTGFTIADPQDRGMLDVVGFDSNAPKVVSDFAAGRI